MLKNNTIYKGLSALIITFVLGYLGIIIIHNVFNDIVNDLDSNVKNEYSRYKIGEYILKEIGAIESNYYKMGIVTKLKAIKPIQDKIKSEIKDIRNAVRILENGGILNNHIKLNLLESDSVVDNIYFMVDKNSTKYTFEAIDLLPKLDELTLKLSEMEGIMKIRLANSLNDEDVFRVKLFFKQLPTLFIRMQENGSRLLHDSKKNIELLEKNIKEKKDYYRKLEYLFTFFVMTIVLILGIFVIRQILKKSKELEDISEKAKKSENEALKANRAKSQFLANMSHEIRTPLNAIIGFSDILAFSSIEEKSKEKADIISKSAKALLSIINDILDISKIESGKFEISETKFNLPNLLEQIVQLYSVNTKQKNIRFFYTLDERIPDLVISDETKLKQVLSNIISNAIKFTPEDKIVSLSVKLIEEKYNHSKIEFSVKDEGIGISKEYEKKIFEPFSQADDSISRKFGGTGLGLAICRNILKMLGSEIKIQSKENEGSIFSFAVDFKIPKKDIEEKELKYKFALCDIVDDSENIRNHLRFVLKEFGTIYEKEEIDSQEQIDMIFCFGDPQFFEKLSRRKKRLTCPVVYVGNMTKLDNNIMKPLMDYYLDVPIYGSKIFNIIAEVKSIEKENKEDFNLENLKNNFKGKVLVAEDNTNNQLLIELIFKDLGLDACIVENGKLAYEKYQEEDYDLVFLDINMPILDGLDALKLIRKYEKEQNKHTPIIALTANTINGDKEKYLKAGMDFYLSKPIENQELLKILSIYLNKETVQEVEVKVLKEVKKLDINVSLVSEKLGISENIAKMIIDKFNSNIEKDIKEFEDIIITEDKNKISQKAHYLKNSCLNVALDEVCDVLAELESKELSINEIEEKFKKLKALLFG